MTHRIECVAEPVRDEPGRYSMQVYINGKLRLDGINKTDLSPRQTFLEFKQALEGLGDVEMRLVDRTVQ